MKSIKIKSAKALLLFFLQLVLLVSCKNQSSSEETETSQPKNETEVILNDAQFKNAGIAFGLIEQKTLSSVLEVIGKTDVPPQNLISISAPLGGIVYSTDLLQGMKIKKGQPLVVIENIEYVELQQNYIAKKSQLAFLEAEFNRQEELSKQNVNSQKVLQQTTSDYLSLKAQVKGLREKLTLIGINTANFTEENISRRIPIYSPIDGYVSEVNVNIGKFVSPNEVMFELVNTEHLHAELTVYEKDVANIKIGQSIRLTLPNQSNSERNASVYLIGRKISADRSVMVHAHLDEEDENLLPGMYINAKIELNKHHVNAVLDAAIVTSENKHYVFVLKKKNNENEFIFEMIEVKKGVSEVGFTEINFLEKINNTDLKIVTKGAYTLLSVLKNAEEE